MKPRITLDIWSLDWVCKFRGTRNGYGATPKAAYLRWKAFNQC